MPGVPSTISAVSGSPQSQKVSTAFPSRWSWSRITWATPVPAGIATTFTAVPAAGASATLSGTMTTDGSGQVSVTATANGTVGGLYSINAMAGSVGPATFLLTNTATVPATVTITGGTTQSTLVNTDFPTALTITVTNSQGDPVPSQVVTFAGPGSGASAKVIGAGPFTTSGTGTLSVMAHANSTAGGPYSFVATAGPATAAFHFTNTPLTASDFPATSIFYQDVSDTTAYPNDADSTNITLLKASSWAREPLRLDSSFYVLTADPGPARRAIDDYADNDLADAEPDCDDSPVPLPPGGTIEGNDLGSNSYTCSGLDTGSPTDSDDCHLLVYQAASPVRAVPGQSVQRHPDGWHLLRHLPGRLGSDQRLLAADQQPLQPRRRLQRRGRRRCPDRAAPGQAGRGLGRSHQPRHAYHVAQSGDPLVGVYVHLATHIGGPSGSSTAFLPYGARLRLKASVNISGFSGGALVVATALKKYGMFVADGGNVYISATADIASAVATNALTSLPPSDFEWDSRMARPSRTACRTARERPSRTDPLCVLGVRRTAAWREAPVRSERSERRTGAKASAKEA